MDKQAAYNLDKVEPGNPFYAEEEDCVWCVFGTASGFAYGTFSSKGEAERFAEKMNQELTSVVL